MFLYFLTSVTYIRMFQTGQTSYSSAALLPIPCSLIIFASRKFKIVHSCRHFTPSPRETVFLAVARERL